MANSRSLNLNNDDAIIPIPRKKRKKRNNAVLEPVIQSATTAANLQKSINTHLKNFRAALRDSITIPMPLQAGQTGHRIFSMLDSSDMNNYALTSRQAYINVREWQRQNQHTLFAAPVERSIKDAQNKIIKKSEKANALTHFTSKAFLEAHELRTIGGPAILGTLWLFVGIRFFVSTVSPLWLAILMTATPTLTCFLAPLLFQETCAPTLSKHFTEVKSDYDTTAEVVNALAATLNDKPISEVLQQINQHFGEHDAAEEEDDLMKMEAGLRLSDESSHHEADVADDETALLLRRQ